MGRVRGVDGEAERCGWRVRGVVGEAEGCGWEGERCGWGRGGGWMGG